MMGVGDIGVLQKLHENTQYNGCLAQIKEVFNANERGFITCDDAPFHPDFDGYVVDLIPEHPEFQLSIALYQIKPIDDPDQNVESTDKKDLGVPA